MFKKRWQVETDRYVPRISAAMDLLDKAQGALATVPRAPLDREPKRKQQVALQMMIFNLGVIRATDQLYDTFGLLWSEGRFVGVSLPIRLAMEFWGALFFGQKVLADFATDGDIERAVERCARLTTGARTPVRLPQGGFTEAPPYSVMEFIRRLDARSGDALATYEFLCEACHPNFLQNFYFFLASQTYDNWANDVFREHTHTLLERTIVAAETIAAGLVDDTKALMALADGLIKD